MKKLTSALALSAILAMPGLGYAAGNVASYTFSLGDKKTEKFQALTGATEIPMKSTNWLSASYIFGDGEESLNGYTGPGFPIGFDFHFAGQIHNQFAISPGGSIMLGKDKVEYAQMTTPGIAYGHYNMQPQNCFQIAFQPMMWGFKKGTISYKTEGEPGNRVCTVEYKNMVLDENGIISSDCGKISFQIRLYEADGKVQIAYIDNQIPFGHNSIGCGIRGWDMDDTMILFGGGLDRTPSVKYHSGASIVIGGTTISWNNDDADYGMNYNNVFNFNPCNDTTAPSAAPTGLKAEESGTDLLVSCQKAAGSDYTIILYSTEPFTDADMPIDGISPLVTDINGDFATTYGNATVIYNGAEANPSVTVPNIPSSMPIYIRALSANGYPAYNRTDMAELQITTTQAPPSNFRVSSVSAEGITVAWRSEYPVIIGHTDTYSPFLDPYNPVNQGIFGNPLSATPEVGDALSTAMVPVRTNPALGQLVYEEQAGGDVVYVGSGTQCTIPVEKFTKNYASYLKIWSVKDGVVSSAGNQLVVVPQATMPFEPKVEDWMPTFEPQGWINSSADWGFRPYMDDSMTRSMRGGTPGTGETISLTTPEIPVTKASTLTFGWTMQTANPPYQDPDTGIWMNAGMGQGMFWDPENGEKPAGVGFSVKAGPEGTEKEYFFTDVWGSYGYKNEQVAIEAPEGGKMRISFNFNTFRTGVDASGTINLYSLFHLRNIKLTDVSVGIETVIGLDGLAVTTGHGTMTLASDTDRMVDVYALTGIRVASVNVEAGVASTIDVPAGIYIVNGNKVVVK